MLSNGFVINDAYKCMFHQFVDGSGVIICLYVDDALILGTDIENIKDCKRFIYSAFKIKDLGEIDAILGLRLSDPRHAFC